MNEREAIRAECVEVMAKARYESFWERCLDPSAVMPLWADEDNDVKNDYRRDVEPLLAALEAAVHTADCPTCDHGTDPATLTTCNTCEGTGSVVLGGLLMALVGERVGWHGRRIPDGVGFSAVHVYADDIPVFRARSMEEKT